MQPMLLVIFSRLPEDGSTKRKQLETSPKTHAHVDVWKTR